MDPVHFDLNRDKYNDMTFLLILYFFCSLMIIFLAYAVYETASELNRYGEFPNYTYFLFVAIILGSIGVANIVLAYGLDQGWPWARPTAWVLATFTAVCGSILLLGYGWGWGAVIILAVVPMLALSGIETPCKDE
jgi:hypothetical protein